MTSSAPAAFRLKASNGYSLTVLAASDPHTGRGEALLLVQDKSSSVTYATAASVTETSIEADLGSIGKIDVHFVATGGSKTEGSGCGGKPVSFDSGRYEGTIDFEGENGYSEVHATSAPAEVQTFLRFLCVRNSSEGTGGHSPGARLTVRHRGSREFEFTARTNSHSRPARFTASVSETRGALSISRSVTVAGAPRALSYDVPAGVAKVDPPAPFAGEATYLRQQGTVSSWHGNLSVDFPGRSGVRLAGAGTRASLIRAVQNPGHPFRVP